MCYYSALMYIYCICDWVTEIKMILHSTIVEVTLKKNLHLNSMIKISKLLHIRKVLNTNFELEG